MGTDRWEQLRREFGYEQWAGRTSLQESLAVWRYFVAPSLLQGWRLHGSQRFDSGPATRTELIFTRPTREDDELLRVDVFECSSLVAAHEQLLRVVADFQSAAVTQVTGGPGDVAFGNGDFTQVFARANLVVMLRNAGRNLVPVTQSTRLIDAEITSRPEVVPNRVSPTLTALELEDREPKVGSRVPIRVEAADPLGRDVWFKAFASGGDLSIEDDRLTYTARVAGSHRMTVFVLNENQGVATRSLDVRVT